MTAFMLTLTCSDCGRDFEARNRRSKRCLNCKRKWWNKRRGVTAKLNPRRKRPVADPADLCPDCGELLTIRVSANGSGNDLLDRCEACGWFRVGLSLYDHNNSDSHRFKYRHGLSGRTPEENQNEPVSIPSPSVPPAESGWRWGRF